MKEKITGEGQRDRETERQRDRVTEKRRWCKTVVLRPFATVKVVVRARRRCSLEDNVKRL